MLEAPGFTPTLRRALITLIISALAFAIGSAAGARQSNGWAGGAIVLTPSSLVFSSYGPGSAMTFTAAEAGYSGYFEARSGDPKVATVTRFSTSQFAVVPLSDGNATISITDTRRNSARLPVQVSGPLNRYGHLYVGGGSTSQRYLLVNGVPTAAPDASYLVGSSGTLASFAIAPSKAGDMYFASGGVVVVYSGLRSGNVQPLYQLYVGTNLSALAIHNSFLYVGGLCCSGLYYQVAIYEADARKGELPWQVFSLPNPRFKPASDGQLALDQAGDLYVSRTTYDSVEVYSTPLTQPTLTRTITSASLQRPVGVAIGPFERLYVANGNGTIAVFAPGASGRVKPERLIMPSNPGSFTSLALLSSANRLFVADSYDILEFPENASGTVAPLRFNVQAYGLAVGP
jgi:hypothetical protein